MTVAMFAIRGNTDATATTPMCAVSVWDFTASARSAETMKAVLAACIRLVACAKSAARRTSVTLGIHVWGSGSTVTPILLTVSDAAARYRTTPSALYEFIRRRPWLPVTRIGRSILIDPDTFEAALNKRAEIDLDRRERDRNRRYFRGAS